MSRQEMEAAIAEIRAVDEELEKKRKAGLLKPCPFCGNKIEYVPIDFLPFQSIGHKLCLIKCPNCTARVSFLVDDDFEAVAAWNKRVNVVL